MRVKPRLLLFLAVLAANLLAGLLFAPSGPAAGEEEPAAELNEEWVASDLELAEALAKVAKPAGLTVGKFLETLGSHDARFDRKLGYGGRQLHLAKYGGYTTAWLHVVAEGDTVVGLRIHFRPSGEAWAAAEKRYSEALGKGFTRADDGLHRTWWDSDAYHRMRYAVQQVLGAPAESDVPEELSEPYALLTSPLHTFDFGSSCYESGDKPEGRVAIEALVAAKRWDLVGNVLRELNPEGRVYAAEALMLQEKQQGRVLSRRDREAVGKVTGLEIPIRACSGCELYETTAAKLLNLQDR